MTALARPSEDGLSVPVAGIDSLSGPSHRRRPKVPLPDETVLRGIAERRVLPQRHPGRWIASALVLLVAAQIVHGFATNKIFQWSVFRHWVFNQTVLDGLEITLKATLYSAILGFIGGVLLALGRLSKNPLLRAVSWTYIWIFRSVPLLVVLLLAYNFGSLYPHISLGIPFGPSMGPLQRDHPGNRPSRWGHRTEPERGRLCRRGGAVRNSVRRSGSK